MAVAAPPRRRPESGQGLVKALMIKGIGFPPLPAVGRVENDKRVYAYKEAGRRGCGPGGGARCRTRVFLPFDGPGAGAAT